MTSRRAFLGQALAAGLVTQLPGLSFARTPGESRLVLVILRGALDGLGAVPPYADPDYADARRDLALARPGASNGALKLDGLFGLHPSLEFLHERYGAKELVVFHAIASPYRERSHFDAQNLLENGTPKPYGSNDGWLNRALAGLPAKQTDTRAVALAQNIPLVLRGKSPVTSWAPSALPEVEPDFIGRLADLYAADERLAERLREATDIDVLAGSNDMEGKNRPGRAYAGNQRRLELMAETAGKFLAAPDGPRIAVMEATGWDTHAQQGAAQGQLALRLKGLDTVMSTLATNLKTVWPQTAVLVVTEFGRTVAINGSRGTDHGTATCAFLMGGAVNGGRVVADWPGLAPRNRYQGRDLNPTLDLRSVAKGLLTDHLKITDSYISTAVFPDSTPARPQRDLIRA